MDPDAPFQMSRSPLDTAEIPEEEILRRLELGRLHVLETPDGARLETTRETACAVERRKTSRGGPAGKERRGSPPLAIPTLFPARGPIRVLLVGGLADERALREATPFWREDGAGGCFIWQALAQAGLIHRKDMDATLGRGGFWDDQPPRTLGLAMTYSGFRPRGGRVDFDHVAGSWNQHRLQTLIQACRARSMGRLKILTIGHVAKFMLCASVYGMADLPLLFIPEPSGELLEQKVGPDSAAFHWMEWASKLLGEDE